MTTFFVGDIINPDGEVYHCAGTRIPNAATNKITGALVVLDALSPLYGSSMPVPNQLGWAIRPLARDVSPSHAADILGQAGAVVNLSPMPITQVIQKVGSGAIRGLPIITA